LYFTAHQIERPFQTSEVSDSIIKLHHEFVTDLLSMVTAKKGQLASSYPSGCSESSAPAGWIHHMMTFDEISVRHLETDKAVRKKMSVKKMATPTADKERNTLACQKLDPEGSLLVKIEAPCDPRMESGEAWSAHPGTSEQDIPDSMAESKATISLKRRPSEEAVSTSTHKTPHREPSPASSPEANEFSRTAHQVKGLAPPSFFPVSKSGNSLLDRAFEVASCENIDEGDPPHGSSMRLRDSCGKLENVV